MPQENELYNEWASGVSLANSGSNEYFQEIPLELNKPAEFQVAPEQLPPDPAVPIQANPAEPEQANPAPAPAPEPEKNIEVRPGKHGGQITLEKTTRGWRAVLDSGESSIPAENFYAANKDELIFNVLDAKLEASKAIRRLKKEKLLGGEDGGRVVNPVPPQITQTPVTHAPVLTADDIMEIKNKLSDNPVEAFEAWMSKRFGYDSEQMAAALKAAEEAKSILAAQSAKADIEDVNRDFIRENSDWAQDYSSEPENVRKLIARMAKAHLNKRISVNSPQAVIDNIIYDLYTRGYWTTENLETAKEELIDGGLLEKTTTVSPVPQPQPQPEAPKSGPSVTEAPRIATQSGQPVGLGLPARSSTPAATPDSKPLSDVDLEKMDMKDLRAIAAAQLQAMRQQK